MFLRHIDTSSIHLICCFCLLYNVLWHAHTIFYLFVLIMIITQGAWPSTSQNSWQNFLASQKIFKENHKQKHLEFECVTSLLIVGILTPQNIHPSIVDLLVLPFAYYWSLSIFCFTLTSYEVYSLFLISNNVFHWSLALITWTQVTSLWSPLSFLFISDSSYSSFPLSCCHSRFSSRVVSWLKFSLTQDCCTDSQRCQGPNGRFHVLCYLDTPGK